MELKLFLHAKDSSAERRLTIEIKEVMDAFPSVHVQVLPGSSKGEHDEHLEMVDSESEDLTEFLEKLNRQNSVICLIVPEEYALEQRFADLLLNGQVDDIIISPLRPLEMVAKFRYHERVIAWKQTVHLSGSFAHSLDALQKDLQVLERYHRQMLPQRFSDMGNLRVATRFIGGEGPGGDYFDASSTSEQAVFILTHSSSYGLSSSFITALAGTMMKLALVSQKEESVLLPLIQNIQEESAQILKSNDELSLFYGTYFRRNSEFRFVNLGRSEVWGALPHQPFQSLQIHGEPITCDTAKTPIDSRGIQEHSLHLAPGSRITIISEGFLEALGRDEIEKILNSRRENEGVDSLSDLAFQVSRTLNDEDSLPRKDCSAITFEVQANVFSLKGSSNKKI